jgi:hypothetical protein
MYVMLVLVGVPAVIGYFVFDRWKNYKFVPEPEYDVPFKVDVTVRPIQDSALLKMVRGRALTHRLEIKVRIGPKDWQRIKDAGLYDAILFDYPDATSTYSGERGQYCVCHLRTDGAAAFYNIGDAYAAKEKLIHSLHELRQAIDVQKEGVQNEVLEI